VVEKRDSNNKSFFPRQKIEQNNKPKPRNKNNFFRGK
jgi:hypothetical protein